MTNREILFRGKRIDNGEWVYGYVILLKNKFGVDTHYIYTGQLHDGGLYTIPERYEVDPDTIGQYIEQTDNNDAKIFSGDILKLCDENNDYTWYAIVSFGNPNGEYVWGWNLVPIGTFHGDYEIGLWMDMPHTICKIIGNIFDNPELVKE